jgi:pyridoxal phosphate enzyme (YggS family)
MSVAENLKTVLDRIAAAARRAGRDPAAVTLVAVSKTVGLERIREAVAAGAGVLGENRVQEAREKIEALGRIAHWHLIGHLQTNKAKYAVRLFDLIHSVDNIELAKELDKQAAKAGKVQDVLVEVNIAGEQQKAGMSVKDAASLVRDAAKLGNVRVRGLMTMPPWSEKPEESRPHYRRLRDLSAAIDKEGISGVSMRELSMGMSGDFEIAVEEGATLVRVGTAIFGERD